MTEQNQGKYEQAGEMNRQVLRLSQTVLGKEHPNTLASMSTGGGETMIRKTQADDRHVHI